MGTGRHRKACSPVMDGSIHPLRRWNLPGIVALARLVYCPKNILPSMPDLFDISLDGALARRIASVVGARPVELRRVSRGYTPAGRLVATFAGGDTLFVKLATDELTAGWLRDERRVYESLNGSFIPRCHGWEDDGERPMLLLEDLSAAHWPPPWSREQIESLLDTLRRVSASSLEGAPRLGADSTLKRGWRMVADDPAPFLGLGLASPAWLDRALPLLLDALDRLVLEGESLLHCDVRSDNVCFVGGRGVLVDWNWACIGNPRVDIGAWLPSLRMEGGPLPESILPDAPEMAAMISGFFARHAGLPGIPDAPFVRPLQRRQLSTALPWAVRALGLPPLDGEETGGGSC